MSSLLQVHERASGAPTIVRMSKCIGIMFDKPISLLFEGGIQLQIKETKEELIEAMRQIIERNEY